MRELRGERGGGGDEETGNRGEDVPHAAWRLVLLPPHLASMSFPPTSYAYSSTQSVNRSASVV